MIAGISVKFNENTSRVHHIPGSGPQGTLLGVLENLVQCNNNADCVDETLRFKYELVSLSLFLQR